MIDNKRNNSDSRSEKKIDSFSAINMYAVYVVTYLSDYDKKDYFRIAVAGH